MKELSSCSKQLQTMFGPRVGFDKMERRIYSHDVGVLPKLIKPLVGDTTPAAVVQPMTRSSDRVGQLGHEPTVPWCPGARPPPAMAA